MIRNFEDMQKLGQTNVDSAMKMLGEWNKNWQAIAAEMSDYTKRSFEESTTTLEKLMSSKSVEQAVEIQTSYAKRAYDDYMQQMSKIGGMYAIDGQRSLQARREDAAERRLSRRQRPIGCGNENKGSAHCRAFFVSACIPIICLRAAAISALPVDVRRC